MSLRTVPVGGGGGMILTGWSGLVAGQIPFPVDSTTLTSSAGFAWGTAAGQGLTLASGTATTDVQNINASVTWNAAGVTFEGWKLVITDTASAAGSLALQILGGVAGTTNLLSLSKAGTLTLGVVGSSLIVGTGFALRDGGTVLDINDFTNGSTYVRINTSNGDITIKDGGVLGWTIGATSAGFSRISNGLIGVGTGAAGSFAGSLKLTDVTAVGKVLHGGSAPSITAGGGTGPTIAGTDEAFTITIGTGGIASSVTVTFASAFAVAPRCSPNHEGAILITRAVSTTTTVTIDAATPFTASGKITCICRSGTT